MQTEGGARFQNLSLFSLPAGFRGRGVVAVQLWWLVEATLFRWSPQFAYGWRRVLLRLFGGKIGDDVLVRSSARITYPWKLTIGHRSWIGDDVDLYTLGEIVIGSDSVISQRSYICTGSHDTTSPAFAIFAKPVTIGAGCWIATDVFVAPGVTIGDGTVVGARSTVMHDLPPRTICHGHPAKAVQPRELAADAGT